MRGLSLNKFAFKIKKLIRILPLLLIIGSIVFYFSRRNDISVEQIINFTPQNYYLAIISILGLYAIKSLSIVFPLPILYVSTGIIFSPLRAVLINIAGITVALTLPFLIGEFSGHKKTMELIEKYPKLQKINTYKKSNQWLFVFVIRMVGFLPMDVVSIFMGSIGTPYRKYMSASILAMIPNLLAVTFIGATVNDPDSPGFIIACIAKIVITLISILVYRKSIYKHSN